jgi:thiol-disulfide isomerase/thioredoxin
MLRIFLFIFFLYFAISNSCAENTKSLLSNFALQDISGKTHHISDYRGKWLLVNYWATWCPPCLEEIPDLIALYDKHHNTDLMVLGIAFDYKNEKEVSAFVDDMLISYPVILGNQNIANSIGSAEILPTTYIYNPKGQLINVKRGLITKSYIEKLIAETK